MSISLFIIGIVIGGIATLVTLIFMIISFATGKNNNAAAWVIGFVIAITVLIISIFNVVRKVGEKVKSGVEWLEEHKGEYDNNSTYDDSGYSKTERENFLDTLKKYTHPAHADKVPADYYKNEKVQKDEMGRYVLPFVYPLSVRYDEISYTGEIISDINDSVYLPHITEMSFDENFVIAKVNNAGDAELLKSGRGEVEYILFDLRSREFLNFVSNEMLVSKAGKIGYTGPTYMTPLSELYQGWLDPLDFDF